MVVLARQRSFVLVAFDGFAGREGRVRLHRNCVFVVERLSWVDVALVAASRYDVCACTNLLIVAHWLVAGGCVPCVCASLGLLWSHVCQVLPRFFRPRCRCM